MLDIKFIRDNTLAVKQATRDKGYTVDIDELLRLDTLRRDMLSKTDSAREERNKISSQMKGSKPSPALIEQGKKIKEEIATLEEVARQNEEEYTQLLKMVPNMPWNDVPIGASEDENVVVETVGQPTKFDFAPKNHWEIGETRGLIDKKRAAKVAGARFTYLMGDLVKLQFAVIQFVIDTLTDEDEIKKIIKKFKLKDIPSKPFTPILPPLMIKTEIYDSMDRLEPREDRYKIDGEELWLQGSAEHVLGSMYANEIIDERNLPLRMLGFASSFRKEAGTYGKDMEGIFRVHQFDKLEMESLATGDTSFNEHLFFVAIQRYLIEKLELPYRVVMKCTADIGKPNARGVDIDVWLPGQGKYRETHTADYMTDYQARRLKTRVRRENGDIELAHTNDATAFALGRILIAIIENYQNADEIIRIPKVLQKYINGKEKI